jgi:hypothetical protein
VRVASLCSLPFGVVPWSGSEPMLSVVVKATFSLAANGEAPLASEQEPLRIDESDPLSDAAGLRYASDFAPQKARADVLVVGHAHAADRVDTIPVRMTLDVLDKRVVARSAEPTTRIPLVARHLRTSESPSAAPVAVGPRSAWSPERIAFGGAELGIHGAPLHPLGDDFDFQFFNAAPLDQQVGMLRANGAMTLEGLMPGGARREAHLPGSRPRVFYFGNENSGDHATEVPLISDTLWIDTDRAICVVVWRGVITLSRAIESPDNFVLSLEARGGAKGWPALRNALGSAKWDDVTTPEDVVSEGADLDPALLESVSIDDDISDEVSYGAETITTIRDAKRPARPPVTVTPISDDEPTLLRGEPTEPRLREDAVEAEQPATTIPMDDGSGGGADLSLEIYAELQVELSMQPNARDEILRSRAVSRARYRAAELRYASALAVEAARGGDDLSRRLDAALERARRRLAERG